MNENIPDINVRNIDYISRQVAIIEMMDNDVDHAQGTDGREVVQILEDIPAADVAPYSIDPDGTLTVTVPKGMKRIGRILIEEDGTQYGGLFYPDTGGCFLSSMERSE